MHFLRTRTDRDKNMRASRIFRSFGKCSVITPRHGVCVIPRQASRHVSARPPPPCLLPRLRAQCAAPRPTSSHTYSEAYVYRTTAFGTRVSQYIIINTLFFYYDDVVVIIIINYSHFIIVIH